MTTPLKTFLNDDSGAVSVDWVVITSVIVGMAIALTAVVFAGYENLATDTRNAMANTVPEIDPFSTNTDVTASNDIALE